MQAVKSLSVAVSLLVVGYFVFKVMFLKDELNRARVQLSEAINANAALNETLNTLKVTQEAAVKALNEKYITELKETQIINEALQKTREEFLSGEAEFLSAFNKLEARFEDEGVLEAEPKKPQNVKTKFDFSGGELDCHGVQRTPRNDASFSAAGNAGELEEENASAKREILLTDEEREFKKREAIKEVFSNSWK